MPLEDFMPHTKRTGWGADIIARWPWVWPLVDCVRACGYAVCEINTWEGIEWSACSTCYGQVAKLTMELGAAGAPWPTIDPMRTPMGGEEHSRIDQFFGVLHRLDPDTKAVRRVKVRHRAGRTPQWIVEPRVGALLELVLAYRAPWYVRGLAAEVALGRWDLIEAEHAAVKLGGMYGSLMPLEHIHKSLMEHAIQNCDRAGVERVKAVIKELF